MELLPRRGLFGTPSKRLDERPMSTVTSSSRRSEATPWRAGRDAHTGPAGLGQLRTARHGAASAEPSGPPHALWVLHSLSRVWGRSSSPESALTRGTPLPFASESPGSGTELVSGPRVPASEASIPRALPRGRAVAEGDERGGGSPGGVNAENCSAGRNGRTERLTGVSNSARIKKPGSGVRPRPGGPNDCNGNCYRSTPGGQLNAATDGVRGGFRCAPEGACAAA